jgi:hypothetical protein
MSKRFVALLILSITVYLSTVQPASAQTSETSGKRQSPVQVLTTIAITAVVLRGLSFFKIP